MTANATVIAAATKTLRKAEADARKEYSAAVAKAKATRDSKIAAAYAAFTEATA